MTAAIGRRFTILLLGCMLPIFVLADSQPSCRTTMPNSEIVSFQGNCVDGLLHGRAEAIISYIGRTDGKKTMLKQFGWFERGTATGWHFWMTDKVPLLSLFDKDGQPQGQFTAKWRKHVKLGDPAQFWYELDKVMDFTYPAAQVKDQIYQKTTFISSLLVSGENHALLRNKVTTVGAGTMSLYLNSLPTEDPDQTVTSPTVSKALFPTGVPALLDKLALQPNEVAVWTREGCVLVSDYPASSQGPYRQRFIEEFLRHSWLGECVDGISLGAGKLLQRDDDDKPFWVISEWRLYGRPLGRRVITYVPNPYLGITAQVTEAFAWKRTEFGIRHSAVGARKPQPQGTETPSFAAWLPSGNTFYHLYRSEGDSRLCGAEGNTCLEEDGKAGKQYFPCRADCFALLAQKTAPLIAQFAAYQSQYASDVELTKQSVEPILRGLREAREQDAARLEMQAQHASNQRRQERAVERRAVVSRSNQAHRPVASPNLDALLRQALGAKP